MTIRILLNKLKKQTDISWTEASVGSNGLTTELKSQVVSVELSMGEATKLVGKLNSKLKAICVNHPIKKDKYNVVITIEKLLELEMRQEYFSKSGIEPFLYTLDAKRNLHINHEGYVDLGIETDFSDVNTPRKLVSLVRNDNTERLFIDLDSKHITTLISSIENQAQGKNTQEILLLVNKEVDDLSTNHPSVKGQSRRQVEKELGGRFHTYLTRRELGVLAGKPTGLEVPLDELIDEGLLECRHKGILAAIAIGHLIQKKILPEGTARSYRGEIHNKDGQRLGAHAWAVYTPFLSNEMMVVDPRWLHVREVNINNPEDIGYGLPAMRAMVDRLMACEKLSDNKFQQIIREAKDFHELAMINRVLQLKFGITVFPELTEISQNPALIDQVGAHGAMALVDAFKEDLMQSLKNNPNFLTLQDKIKAQDYNALLEIYFPNQFGMRDKFVELAKNHVVREMIRKVKGTILSIEGQVPERLAKKRIKPCLAQLDEIASLHSLEAAKVKCVVIINSLLGTALTENGAMPILAIGKTLERIIDETHLSSELKPVGFDVNNSEQDTYFHVVARENRLQIWKLSEHLRAANLQGLVDFKAKNKRGRTVIHEALEHNNLELAGRMISASFARSDAMFLLVDLLKWKKNAAKLEKIKSLIDPSQVHVVSQLLEIAKHVTDERISNDRNNNKFIAAVKSQNPQALQSFLVDNSGYFAKSWYELTSKPDAADNTALHHIAKMKDQHIAEQLIEKLANLNIRKTFSLSSYQPHEIIDLEARNKNCQTAFEKAVAKGRFETAKAMLQLYPKERQEPLMAMIENEKQSQKRRFG